MVEPLLAFAYCPFSYFYLYIYETWKFKEWKLLLYMIAVSLFAVGLEAVGEWVGVFHYKKWNLLNSFLVYLVTLGLTHLFYKLIVWKRHKSLQLNIEQGAN
ncbi:hypothetical protein [Paenibacillus alkalitolerans]|uniref:hypothetical protein n=1 Tax=Paenibacillus alkalitolerans TaxID=2799335 RepID=UPI001F1D0AF3|nr:hypothetical protein [Paenibacillus alkalitolerans]